MFIIAITNHIRTTTENSKLNLKLFRSASSSQTSSRKDKPC